MLGDFIAILATGLAATLAVFLLRHMTGGRLPRWITPAAAGLAMIGYSIWAEYSWAGRTIGTLPAGMEVLRSVEEARPWKPWTYLAPQTTRFMALDRAGVQTNAATPGVLLADLYLFARWVPPVKRAQLVDCAQAARADVSEAALADPSQADWTVAGKDDPLIGALCMN